MRKIFDDKSEREFFSNYLADYLSTKVDPPIQVTPFIIETAIIEYEAG